MADPVSIEIRNDQSQAQQQLQQPSNRPTTTTMIFPSSAATGDHRTTLEFPPSSPKPGSNNSSLSPANPSTSSHKKASFLQYPSPSLTNIQPKTSSQHQSSMVKISPTSSGASLTSPNNASNASGGGQPSIRFNSTSPSSPPAHTAPTSTMVAGGLGSGVFLHFDKKLSDCVKQYPCLYDSKTVGYKHKHTATKAWELVAKEVEVENGDHAQKLYFNLKKRFHKRRNFLKRLQRSGTNNQILLKKARSDVSVYSFLDWLIPFTQVRQPRVPIKPEEASLLEAKYLASVENDELEERPSFVDLHYGNPNETMADSIDQKPNNNANYSNNSSTNVYVKQEDLDEDTTMYLVDDEEIVTVRPSSPLGAAVDNNRMASLSPPNGDPTPSFSSNHYGGHHNNHQHHSSMISPNSRSFSNISSTGVYHHHQNNMSTVNTDMKHHHHTHHHDVTRSNVHHHDSNSTKRYRSIQEEQPTRKNVCVESSSAATTAGSSTPRKAARHQGGDETTPSLKNIELENEDSLFGLMVGAELKGLPYKERCVAKLKIQNILFDMQMSALKKKQGVVAKKPECHTV